MPSITTSRTAQGGIHVEATPQAVADAVESLIKNPPPWLWDRLYELAEGHLDEMEGEELEEALRYCRGEVSEMVGWILMEYHAAEFKLNEKSASGV